MSATVRPSSVFRQTTTLASDDDDSPTAVAHNVDKDVLYVAYLDKYFGKRFGFVCFYWICYALIVVCFFAALFIGLFSWKVNDDNNIGVNQLAPSSAGQY